MERPKNLPDITSPPVPLSTFRGLREKLGIGRTDQTDEFADVRSPKTQMALALGRVKRPAQVYGGTVPFAEVQRRRVKNRTARASRRANRGQR